MGLYVSNINTDKDSKQDIIHLLWNTRQVCCLWENCLSSWKGLLVCLALWLDNIQFNQLRLELMLGRFTRDFILKKKVQMEGECFHKTCFRCAHGGCTLTHSSYASLDGVLYCRHHFNQLFLEKGNYAHVLQAANHRRTASGNSLPPEPTEEVAVEAKEENGASQSWTISSGRWSAVSDLNELLQRKIWYHL